MSINIVKEESVYVTADELIEYQAAYRQSYAMYSGTPPTFETFVRQQMAKKAARWQQVHK